jgi:hypothetical protein
MQITFLCTYHPTGVKAKKHRLQRIFANLTYYGKAVEVECGLTQIFYFFILKSRCRKIIAKMQKKTIYYLLQAVQCYLSFLELLTHCGNMIFYALFFRLLSAYF